MASIGFIGVGKLGQACAEMVAEVHDVVGFDIVELAPIKGLNGPDFMAAKLYYKLLSYKFHL